MERVRVRRVAGVDLTVLPGVLDPALFFSSEVLAVALRSAVHPGATVLDVGTGCGIGAVVASDAGAGRVVAVDIDPTAVECAAQNITRHGLGRSVHLHLGDLFGPVGQARFDLVCFNPPYLSGRSGTFGVGLDLALRAPPDLPERFLAGLAHHLEPGGSALLILSTNGRPGSWLDPLPRHGFGARPILARDRGSEVVTAWQISPVEADPPAG